MFKNTKPSIVWMVWVFPIIAAVIAGWLFFDYWRHRGPLIKIIFNDASTVEEQKTPLRYLGINVGMVENVILSKNGKEVTVFARLTNNAKNLAASGTKFWIVKPQVDFEGVRGLETIFRGSYIRVEPGGGKPATEFQGDSGSDNNDLTVTYKLRTPQSDSISVGDSVTFRGLKVGMVSSVDLGPKSQLVEVQIAIEKQYAKLIRTNSIFWRKVGLQANLGLFKSEIKINSLESLMKGGIALAVPDAPGKRAPAKSVFALESAPPKDFEKWNPEL